VTSGPGCHPTADLRFSNKSDAWQRVLASRQEENIVAEQAGRRTERGRIKKNTGDRSTALSLKKTVYGIR